MGILVQISQTCQQGIYHYATVQLLHQKIKSNSFHINPEILEKLLNLIYYLIFILPQL